MKILRVITRLNIGGPSKQARFLHKAFSSPPHSSTLLFGQLDKDEGDDQQDILQQPHCSQLPHLIRPLSPHRDLLTFLQLFWILSSQSHHILHTHTAKAGLLARLAAHAAKPFRRLTKKPKIKVYHTYHGHVFSGYFSNFKTKIFILLEQYLADKSDALITLTHNLAHELSDHLQHPLHRFHIIPLGLNLAPYLNISPPPPSDNTQYLLWVGRLVPIKRVDRLLKLVKAYSIVQPNIHLHIVGDGPDRHALKSLCQELRIETLITFEGWQRDLIPFYEQAHAFINTSDNEGTPVAALEAISAGIPTITTRVGGSHEILPKNEPAYSFPIDTFNKESINTLQSWHTSPQRISWQARKKTVQRHDPRSLEESLLKLYQS